MNTEEEVEALYDEEKKKLLEIYLFALEAKKNQEEAEKQYTKDLNTLFETYKRLKLEAIADATKKAKLAAYKKAKSPMGSGFALIKKLGVLKGIIKR